jgi:hypothetical protein
MGSSRDQKVFEELPTSTTPLPPTNGQPDTMKIFQHMNKAVTGNDSVHPPPIRFCCLSKLQFPELD